MPVFFTGNPCPMCGGAVIRTDRWEEWPARWIERYFCARDHVWWGEGVFQQRTKPQEGTV